MRAWAPRSRRRPTAERQGVRLQKLLSRAGMASRRQAEELIREGRVRVNGEVVTELGSRADPERDVVEVDGRRVKALPARWIALHKPAGVLTTRRDPGGGRTVYDLLPRVLRNLRYVGRLDRETEGLLLLGNQGDLIHRLLHPSSEVEREYAVRVRGRPSLDVLRRLERGVELDDGPARAARVRSLGKGTEESLLSVVMLEGRKREVRRLCAAVGHPVTELRRVRFGPVELGALTPGAWRDLSEEEVQALARRARAGPPSGRPGRGGSPGSGGPGGRRKRKGGGGRR